jgi:hypothetical protein
MSQELDIVDLMELEIPHTIVKLGNQGLKVMGLPYHEMMDVFKGATDILGRILDGEAGVIESILHHDPTLVCKIIAKATGHNSPEAVEKVKRIPVQIQGEILINCFKLSFPDEELLGKLLAQVQNAMVVIGAQMALNRTSASAGLRKPSTTAERPEDQSETTHSDS